MEAGSIKNDPTYYRGGLSGVADVGVAERKRGGVMWVKGASVASAFYPHVPVAL